MTRQLGPGADRVVRRALLGVQFRDAVDGRVVAEGLDVVLQDLWQPRRTQVLVANRSGVFALHAFPGMPGFDDDALASPPEGQGRFRLTAIDKLDRYVATAVAPPVPGDGLYAPLSGWTSPPTSPPASAPHVPLYNASTRALPVGLASLRAELRAAGDDERPIPWARLELWLGAVRLAEGLADAAGRVLLAFPLPRPREATLGTSPAGLATSFEWSVTLRAFWDPARSADTVPLLDEVHAQPEVALLQGASPPLPLDPLTLQAGETLVAKSPPSSFLYVAE